MKSKSLLFCRFLSVFLCIALLFSFFVFASAAEPLSNWDSSVSSSSGAVYSSSWQGSSSPIPSHSLSVFNPGKGWRNTNNFSVSTLSFSLPSSFESPDSIYVYFAGRSAGLTLTVTLNLGPFGVWSGSAVASSSFSSLPSSLDQCEILRLSKTADSSSSVSLQWIFRDSGAASSCVISMIEMVPYSPLPILPEGDGGVFSFTVDPEEFEVVDFRDYASAFYHNCLDNEYWPAIYYPYYTIASYKVYDSTMVVMAFSEEPVVKWFDEFKSSDVDRTVSYCGKYLSMPDYDYPDLNYSSMVYVGYYSGLDESITFYNMSYYSAGHSYNVMNFFDTMKADGRLYMTPFGFDETTYLDPVFACSHTRVDNLGVSSQSQYCGITNYSVPYSTVNQPSPAAFWYQDSPIPMGFMDLYRGFNLSGGDPDGEIINAILSMILEKVTHIDNDIHSVFGDQDAESNDSTAAVDQLYENSKGSMSSLSSDATFAVEDIISDSDDISDAIGSITTALGSEWTILVALSFFAIVAIILQRRTG